MTNHMIPEVAVEAAARAIDPTLWDSRVWRPIFFGDRPSERRAKDQAELMAVARAALEAAAPLMAQRLDDSYVIDLWEP